MRCDPRWLPVLHALWLLVALVLAPAGAWAAVAATPSQAPATPIAVADILARADDDQQQLDRARRLLASADPVERLAHALDLIEQPVQARLVTTTGLSLRELPVMRLESLARHWAFDARRLDRWDAQARRVLAPYGTGALQLTQLRAAWAATRAEGLLDDLPPALSARVDAMLVQIDMVQAELGNALVRQFDLTQRAGQLRARIQDGGDDVASAIEDIDARLLQMDSPPLWEGAGQRLDSDVAWAAVQRGVDIEVQFARDYQTVDAGNRMLMRFIQVLLLPLILWLVIRSRRRHDGAPGTERATQALRRPLSAWLLLSMLAALALEPDAPMLVQETILLIALIPVLRLLPAGTLRALGVWPYVAVALYALDRLGVGVVADPGLYRLYLLALSVLALGLTLWMLRSHLAGSASLGLATRRGMRAIGWFVSILLAVAVVANVTGNVLLAETITSGVIDSGYMALLLYSGVSACVGILRALLGQPEVAARRLVREHGALLQAVCLRLLVLAAAIGWLLYSMDRFRLLRPLQGMGAAVLGWGIDVGEVSIHVGDVLIFLVSVWLALCAARVVRRLLRDELPTHTSLPRGLGNSIASLSYYGVLLLGLLIALSAAGFNVSQLVLVFSALGVGIGFGLQNVVNNFVSGLVLMFERPIQPGDVVDVAGTFGSVRQIGLRATVIRTFDGADVVLPNGLLLSGNLINWTMFDRSRRIDLELRVAHGSDPAQVLALLLEVARSMPGLAQQPPPAALVNDYGESSLGFVLRAWAHEFGDWAVLRSELLAKVLAAFQAAGITIPHSQMDVHLHTVRRPGQGRTPRDAQAGGDTAPPPADPGHA